MNNETIDRLIEELGPVTEKLGEGAERVYRLAVRQAMVEGVLDILAAIFFAILVYISYRVVLYAHGEVQKDELSGWAPGGVFVALGGVTFIFAVVIYLSEGIRNLINPHWAAFEIIMETVVGS